MNPRRGDPILVHTPGAGVEKAIVTGVTRVPEIGVVVGYRLRGRSDEHEQSTYFGDDLVRASDEHVKWVRGWKKTTEVKAFLAAAALT